MTTTALDFPAAELIAERCEILEVDSVTQRDEWLQMRKGGLGGSDIGPIFGISPYRSGLRVWGEKTNRIPEQDLSRSEPVIWGTLLEHVIGDEWARRAGAVLHRPKAMFVSRSHPQLFANPDGLFFHPDDGEPSVLEVKAPGINTASDWADGAIPPWYEAQGLHYGAVLGLRRVVFAVLIAGQVPIVRTLEVTDEAAEMFMNASSSWWNRHIVADVAPPADASTDATEVLCSMWTSEDTVLHADQRDVELAAAYCEAHERMKSGEADKAAYGNAIRDRLAQNRTLAYDGTVLATWKPPRKFIEAELAAAEPELYARYCTSFDRKWFEADHPEVLNRFKRESDTERTLLVKPAATTTLEKIHARTE